MSDEEEILESTKDISTEPLEVKIVEKKVEKVNDELDYESMEITDQEIKECEDGNK